jgi:hypothetical protein
MKTSPNILRNVAGSRIQKIVCTKQLHVLSTQMNLAITLMVSDPEFGTSRKTKRFFFLLIFIPTIKEWLKIKAIFS